MNPSEGRWRQAILPASATIEQAIRNLEQTSIKIVLVVNEAGVLEGTISDGDIRRGLIKGLNLASSIAAVVHRDALVVPPDMRREVVMQLMAANKIQQIPAVDNARRIVGMHLWDEISTIPTRSNKMVIMAGGMGSRLRPLTDHCPKPMLPVAGRAMLEHIIERAKSDGFNDFVIAIHYLGHMIEEHFGNGEKLGVKIDYIREKIPSGTAGALALLRPNPDSHLIVTNGDIITDISYGSLLDFHIQHSAAATMAVRVHEWHHPFGVVQTNGVDIVGIEEKPIIRRKINAGIYALDPVVLNLLISNGYYEMPALFDRLRENSMRTVAYPMFEPWMDLGTTNDLSIANEEILKKTKIN